MATVHLRHATTGAVISVEVPPTGLHEAYARSGWVEFTPEPEPEKKPATKAARKQPAEPVNPSPATAPVTTSKE
jgi:hypothetical protein